ncbi:MAG: M20/M25/M40 family metallo-hydrolase [Synergistaceae bacterium]|jgi:arginine utilization protein RocB|nr:M20/M25/M40 family metallo-hydrolase [Synergistaceae bacterium]
MDDVISRRIEHLLFDFVGKYTASGTKNERLADEFYRDWFDSVGYLRKHPGQCGFFQIPGDHLDRSVPWCLIRGKRSRTAVLLHHYDVVDTDDYAALAGIATLPDELAEAFGEGRMKLDADAERDLAGGEWIFGRGTADMKGGACVQMALCERYARAADAGELAGNVVMVGLPDEENLSAGGRAAPLVLKKLKDKWGLKYLMAINSEPTDRTLGLDKPKLYVSSIGKILPLIYAKGVLSHAGRVYEGLNPIKIMASVVRKLDLNEYFIDSAEGVTSAPATFLYLKDVKETYDVSLPVGAAGCLNVMYLGKSVVQLMEKIKDICGAAFAEAIEDARRSFDAFMDASGGERTVLPWRPLVKTYSEVYREAVRDGGEAFISELARLVSNLKERLVSGDINQVEASRAVVETTLKYAADRSPVIVTALAPPYYPVVSNATLPDPTYAEGIADAPIEESRVRFGDTPVRHCLVGMSDFSFFLRNPNSSDADYVRDNMLLWGDFYSIPFEEINEISMPIMNVGPWGKGIHTYLERVWKKDLLERTPHLLDFAVRKILGR